MSEEEKLLKAAYAALRSYQYGNQSTELAKSTADAIDKYLSEIASSQAPRNDIK